jgi:predicted ATPase/signal transduction histidine kinase
MQQRRNFSSTPISAPVADDSVPAPENLAPDFTPALDLRALIEQARQPEDGARASTTPQFVGHFLDIAVQLARAVAGLHQAGIVHRALNPANIGWNGAVGPASLVGFSGNQAVPDADLAYISPEQTGRTGRSVDTRTDLYALGAIFHALLTGAPPFTAADPIELVHAHLARRPVPVHAINPAVPAVLSDLILKLLEKEPERRYLSAGALVADLEEILAQWARTGAVQPFALAIHDVPRELSISDQLYGRGREIAILHAAFERARAGRRELVLVTGDPGIGKSVLVSCLAQPVAASQGYFIVGKFDQLQRGVPYAGLVQALRTLVRTLLTEPDPTLAAWRQRIQAAVSGNGQVLVDMLPEIAAILGPQAPVAALEPLESRNRFRQVLTSFLGVFAGAGHPFALFLDDLQWIDAASLELIRQWLADGKTGHLLIVGAYRDAEAGLAHARALTDELRSTGAVAASIALKPLQTADVAALVADALHQDVERCTALATLLNAKTAGNPFFIRRLLRMLHDDGLIGFDAAARAWRWDLDQIQRAPVSDNVLDLMVRTIDRLPKITQELLQAGACIGHRFDLGVLAELTGRTRANIMHELWPALDDGLLLPLREALPTGPRTVPLEQDLSGLPVTLRFVHDRVQQAAYSLLAPANKQAMHLAIGRQRLLLAQADAGRDLARHPQLFDIVNHLNLGDTLMPDAGERLAVAQLNLAAGRKAKGAAAYLAAFDYLMTAKRQLPAQPWQDCPELAYAIHRDLAECAYLVGQHTVGELLLDTALDHAPSRIARADLYSLRVLAATVAADWASALRWGRAGLAVFGHAWPVDTLAAANEAETTAVMRNVGNQRIADLVDQSEVQDEEILACMRLLSLLGPPAYFSGSDVLTFLVTRSTNLSLLHGVSAYSAFAYVFYGALHNARTGEYDVGYAFGKLALALARRFDNRAEESRTLEVFGLVVHAWRAPLRESLPLMQEGHRAGVESGELAYAAFNLCGLLINGLPAGVLLPNLLADADLAIDFATRFHNRTAIDISLPFRQLARMLMGRTRSATSFDDDNFTEARFIADTQANQTALGQYWVARLQGAYLLGDIATARRASYEGARYIQAGILGMVTSAEHSFYTALTLMYGRPAAAALGALEAELAPLRVQLAAWARHCPANFLHKHQIVEAEFERLHDAPWQALELFGAAIDNAQRQGMVQDAALANELAAQLFMQRQPAVAAIYLRAALDGYRRWGAVVKQGALRGAHLALLGEPGTAPHAGAARQPPAGHGIDALGLIKAAQAIAAETEPEQLFRRILQNVVEVAGAQGGMLLIATDGELRVRARMEAGHATNVALDDTALADSPLLPSAIARYVARLRQPLVLDDAAAEGPFASDAAVRDLGLRSVLCVPLTKHDQIVGLLYLENQAMARAFTTERVDVVQALAAQAAISLENVILLRERARGEQSARFLAGAGAALAESLDLAETLARVVALAVPAFADWCFLDLVDGAGHVHRAQVAFADPAQAQLADALKRYSIAPGDHDRQPLTQASHQRRALLCRQLTEQQSRAMATDEAHCQLVEALGAVSLIAVPLVARERTLGVLTFIVAQSGRRYDEQDLALARQFADRCALGMDNASLYHEARAAIQVRDDFLAVASHELRTPLMPLQMQIHLMERRLPSLFENPESAAWLSKSLATLQRQGKRLERLVSELLDIARITGGQLHMELGRVDLEQVVHDVAERLQESGESSSSGSVVTIDCPAPVIGHWDRTRIEQVINNLLSNALKYGQGHAINVVLTHSSGNAVIAVTDRGLGIEAAHLQRIFGRFERAVSASNFGGLGLGLYIVREILATMGGTVQVISAPGEGSTFTVVLPLGAVGDH